jgi:hypothetical protein
MEAALGNRITIKRDWAAPTAARFYCDILDGWSLAPTFRSSGTFSFLIGGVRIDAGPGTRAPIALVVDDPELIAERCWNAGFTVCVRDNHAGDTAIVVTDPFGRQIELVPRLSEIDESQTVNALQSSGAS